MNDLFAGINGDEKYEPKDWHLLVIVAFLLMLIILGAYLFT